MDRSTLKAEVKSLFGSPPLLFEVADSTFDLVIDNALRYVQGAQETLIALPVNQHSGTKELPENVIEVLDVLMDTRGNRGTHFNDPAMATLGIDIVPGHRQNQDLGTQMYAYFRDVAMEKFVGADFDWDFYPASTKQDKPRLYWDDLRTGVQEIALEVLWRIDDVPDIVNPDLQRWFCQYIEARIGIVLGRTRSKFQGDLPFQTDGPNMVSDYQAQRKELEEEIKQLKFKQPMR